jgi:wyosine [tRNA(Phe)-imidazoG37] synthetase (radical SAM superfamily)
MIAFGPVPSRRLGRSLGINNIPPKKCTYSCVYCQLGPTPEMRHRRCEFYQPELILSETQHKVEDSVAAGESIDYLTFVPDGEPTLDIHIDREIDLLRPLGIKIGVITNASLIWREDVREALYRADWVSLKIDTTRENLWHKINRPHPALSPAAIMAGMQKFAKLYRGQLVTETMLLKGVNDSPSDMKRTSEFIARLGPSSAYLSVPTRPATEKWVQPPDEKALNTAFQIMREKIEQVEYLIGYEGNAFAFTGDAENDLLSITAVHPMREDAVKAFLSRAGTDWSFIDRLIAKKKLIKMEYNGHQFFLRVLTNKNPPKAFSAPERKEATMVKPIINYESLVRITKAISMIRDPEEILLITVEGVTHALNVKACTLFLFSARSNELKLAGSYGLSDEYLDKGPISSLRSIASSLEEAKPVAIFDVADDPRIQYPDAALQEGIASILSVPIIIGEKLIGCLRVYTTEPWEFTLDDVNFVQAVAQVVGMALEMCRINKGLKDSIDILKTMRDPKSLKFKRRTPYEGVPKSFSNEEIAQTGA